MFEKLKKRWKVNGLNLVLIITTFALGGSLCGFAGRKILVFTNLEKGFTWIILYIILVTLLWPVCVLLISIPLGQFSFFRKYISKVWNKMTGRRVKRKNKQGVTRIAIFASGMGTNAEKIITAPQSSRSIGTGTLQMKKGDAKNEATSPQSPLQMERGDAKNEATSPPSPLQMERGDAKTEANIGAYEVGLVVCNKPGAGVLRIAEQAGIPSILIERERFYNGDHYLPELQKHGINFLVLAGFLWKIPTALIQAYPKKIINIHPALLPKYGGKGMYGHKVHETVMAAKEKESGISIHFVDEIYDHGEIIFQAACPVEDHDTAETLAQKIHALEHVHYPAVIAETIKKQNRS